LSLAQSSSARTLFGRLPGSQSVVSRFVAGDGIEEALRVIRELTAKGIAVTVDHLGENVATREEASHAADAVIELLNGVAGAGLEADISVKLTQLGLDTSEEFCAGNLRRVLDKARSMGAFVRADMEGTRHTDRILSVVRTMKVGGYGNVGAVIQAYLRRSPGDLAALCAEGISVRLCKGAYQESPADAFPDKKDVDASYARLTEILLGAAKRQPGLVPAIATHDAKMIDLAKAYAKANDVPFGAFEFEMLYGIRRDLQLSLSKQGYRVRVYVPYGTEWYPYFMRRLAERPANLWFFVSNAFKG
jgi:proline dehydrogenase